MQLSGDGVHGPDLATIPSLALRSIEVLRGNWYGDYQLTNNSLSQFQDMSGDVYWDLDLTCDVSEALSVTFGGNNVFDASPDPAPDFLVCCGVPTEPRSVLDWQGPYYFVRGVLRWH